MTNRYPGQMRTMNKDGLDLSKDREVNDLVVESANNLLLGEESVIARQ